MWMYANEIPFPDDIVVVPPISLNRKKPRARAPRTQKPRASVQDWFAERTRGSPIAAASPCSASSAPFGALPADALALVLTLAGLPSVAGLAPTCRSLHRALDADAWRGVAAGLGAPVPREELSSKASSSNRAPCEPRAQLRQWLFGLEGAWLRPCQGHLLTHPNALEALQHAEYLSGGLVRADARFALPFARAVLGAAERCEAELDAARACLSSLVAKAEARPAVFGSRALRLLRDTEADMAERALLARLDAEDAATPSFDYFADWGEEAKGDREIDPEVSLELARGFLAIMERR